MTNEFPPKYCRNILQSKILNKKKTLNFTVLTRHNYMVSYILLYALIVRVRAEFHVYFVQLERNVERKISSF